MNRISDKLRQRLINRGISFNANDNISKVISAKELKELEHEVAERVLELQKSLLIDVENDHNSKDTAKRVAKMMINETFKGRYHKRPRVTEFPNVTHLDEIYVVGPCRIASACSHHLVPITGKLWVGVQPGDNVVGLSKFPRIADWLASRPQIQEEMSMQLADELEQLIKPVGLGLIVKAKHFCCSWRGVKDEDMMMTTSIMRGSFRENPRIKDEFLSLVTK